MRALLRIVVVTLLAAFSFPAVSQAKSGAGPAPMGQVDTGPLRPRADRSDPSSIAPSPAPSGPSLAELAAREQQAQQLADFRGGDVYIYAGSGVVLVLVVVLLVLLI